MLHHKKEVRSHMCNVVCCTIVYDILVLQYIIELIVYDSSISIRMFMIINIIIIISSSSNNCT